MSCTAAFNQVAFRGRNDDGSETTATWKANQNTNWTQAVDENFRVRLEVQETAGCAKNNFTTIQLQYNLNGAGWVNVTGSSNVVRSTASPNVADGANTTNQLTAGTGTFVGGGGFDEVNGVAGSTAMDVAASGHFEVEYCVQIRSADVADNDTVQLRVTDGGTAFAAYDATPSVTASEPDESSSSTSTLSSSSTSTVSSSSTSSVSSSSTSTASSASSESSSSTSTLSSSSTSTLSSSSTSSASSVSSESSSSTSTLSSESSSSTSTASSESSSSTSSVSSSSTSSISSSSTSSASSESSSSSTSTLSSSSTSSVSSSSTSTLSSESSSSSSSTSSISSSSTSSASSVSSESSSSTSTLSSSSTSSVSSASSASSSSTSSVSSSSTSTLSTLSSSSTSSISSSSSAEACPTAQVAASADDCGANPTFNNTAASHTIGKTLFGTVVNQMAARWTGLAEIKGMTIRSARVELKANATEAGSAPNANVFFEDSDSPSQFSGVSDFELRPYTASVAWSPLPDTTNGEWYATPDLSAIVQAVVNRPGFGGVVVAKIVGTSAATREFRTFDSAAADAPRLVVCYVEESSMSTLSSSSTSSFSSSSTSTLSSSSSSQSAVAGESSTSTLSSSSTSTLSSSSSSSSSMSSSSTSSASSSSSSSTGKIKRRRHLRWPTAAGIWAT